MAKALAYLQSGGPTAVINSSLYGAIREAGEHKEIGKVLGSLHGIEGLLFDDLADLGKEDPEQIELLLQTPGAALGSTRYKLPSDLEDERYQSIIKTVRKHDIGYILVNGGNDSMDTCSKLSRLFASKGMDVKVIGVPKTVDNDLSATDHCIGYGSAAKYVINTVKSVCVDASCYKKGKVFVVEVMGRNAGWLTASVDILPAPYRPDLIYLPEDAFDLDEFYKEVKKVHDAKGHCVVAISEGIVFPRDTSSARVDAFGHIQLGGAADALSRRVEQNLGLPTRSIELSLPQRAFPILVSKVDRDEAVECARVACRAAVAGESGKMVSIRRISSQPYQVAYELKSVEGIANVEKKIPPEFLHNVHGLSQSFRDYLRPLIQGEVDVGYEDGIYKVASLRLLRD